MFGGLRKEIEVFGGNKTLIIDSREMPGGLGCRMMWPTYEIAILVKNEPEAKTLPNLRLQ